MLSARTFRDRLSGERDRPSVLVVTDRFAGAVIAGELAATAAVGIVTDREPVADRAGDVDATVGDPAAVETLAAASAADVAGAIVALRSDRRALLVAQLLRTRFGLDHVVVLVGDPALEDAFEGIATVTVSEGAVLAAEACAQFENSIEVTHLD
ncbi:NAD-binding protein [Halomicroarcula sp. GCM10025709]|uniref:NAD-binding protein n=1 Tax=Haloarcula TaxID=2237 RepID=UPI0024C23867|nr:NAD-binding protein [Halomicroarcula sp. YJ-61-S]